MYIYIYIVHGIIYTIMYCNIMICIYIYILYYTLCINGTMYNTICNMMLHNVYSMHRIILCIYIYIYIERERERGRRPPDEPVVLPDLPPQLPRRGGRDVGWGHPKTSESWCKLDRSSESIRITVQIGQVIRKYQNHGVNWKQVSHHSSPAAVAAAASATARPPVASTPAGEPMSWAAAAAPGSCNCSPFRIDTGVCEIDARPTCGPCRTPPIPPDVNVHGHAQGAPLPEAREEG